MDKERNKEMDRLTELFGEFAQNENMFNDLLNILNAEIALPNIPMPTMGGVIFWITIAECNGWKLQQNLFTHHARVLDRHNIRVAWGTVNGMKKAFERYKNSRYL